jgi:hypothetical protein
MSIIFKNRIDVDRLLIRRIRLKNLSSKSEAKYNFIQKNRNLLKRKSKRWFKNQPRLYKKPREGFRFENINPVLIFSYQKTKK